MSENKGKDKLKNKKNVILINPLEIIGQNSLKNNFKDRTKEEIKKEKKLIQENKINAPPLSSKQMHNKNEIKIFENDLNKKDKYFLPEDKNSIFY